MFWRALRAFLALPGLAALLIPPILAAIDPWRSGFYIPGVAIMFLGLSILFWCVRDFYFAGKGTLAPWDPPKHLVVIGLYRYIRNPMYVGVLLLVSGWTLLFKSTILSLYVIFLAIGFHLRVLLHEEPRLRSTFGETWQSYFSAVPRWIPRTRPWSARQTTFKKEKKMSKFDNVSVVKKANIYFDGNVTSRTIEFADGTTKTLGIMLPGNYEFGTSQKEIMEILAGDLDVMLPGNNEWKTFTGGDRFEVPADAKFQLKIKSTTDYCCSYID